MQNAEPQPPAGGEAPTRRYGHDEFGRRELAGRRLKVPFPLSGSVEFAATCPPAILDTDPSGTGLGVWVLVEHDDQYCIYEYAGGIA